MSQSQHLDHSQLDAGSLLSQIISETNITPVDEGYEAARIGIGAFLEEMLRPDMRKKKCARKWSTA